MQQNRLAMDRFLASVERRAFRMAQIATGSREEALDIVQDAMFGLVKRYSEKSEEEWKPLFFRILQSRIRDWYRRSRVRRRWRVWLDRGQESDGQEGEDPLATLADPKANNPADQAILADSAASLDSALRTLTLRQQQAFLLRAWEGMSVRETAVVMRCSEGSVKTHYSRAVHALRNLLEAYWR
ncbi:MAG: RNA polymerase sigma factor [Desulfobacteraceae bacterium]